MKVDRIIIVVLDGVGAGELPDADEYGDSGSNTLANTARAVGGLALPTLGRLGLGNILSIPGVQPQASPAGYYGKMIERSPGKDSVTGHWEMMGIVLERPFPTFPDGFPKEIISEFERRIGSRVIGNFPASGTEIIRQLGMEHVRSGFPIVYTSADSVFQIAAHEAVIPVERLYEFSRIARSLLMGEHPVGRIIARPFEGVPGRFRRTERRRDFPLEPPKNTLDVLAESGKTVHAIGKIHEFFNGRAIQSSDQTTNNAAHVQALFTAVQSSPSDLIFANLEDFDMLYGHRNDALGFARALETFDASLPSILDAMRTGDLLVLTNDHGNDPTTPSTDHSREYAFLLAHSPALPGGKELGIRDTFADLGATVLETFALAPLSNGRSFLRELD